MNELNKKSRRVRGAPPKNHEMNHVGEIPFNGRTWSVFSGTQQNKNFLKIRLALNGTTNQGRANYTLPFKISEDRFCGCDDLYALAMRAPKLLIEVIDMVGVNPKLFGVHGSKSIEELMEEEIF